jgi:hypothetical protein
LLFLSGLPTVREGNGTLVLTCWQPAAKLFSTRFRSVRN